MNTKSKSHLQKVDYNQIFDNIIKIDNGLTPLIEYVRQFPPAITNPIDRYMKVAINIAYKFSLKNNTPLDDTIQCALEQLTIICNNNPNQHNCSLYTYIYQNISRKLDMELSNLKNTNIIDTCNKIVETNQSLIETQSKLLQNQYEKLELEETLINHKIEVFNKNLKNGCLDKALEKYIQKAEDNIHPLTIKILLLQEKLEKYELLQTNLENEYYDVFKQTLLSQQNSFYFFYDLLETKDSVREILNNHLKELMEFNISSKAIIKKFNSRENKWYSWISKSNSIDYIIQDFTSVLNKRINNLIKNTRYRINAANEKIERIENQKEKEILNYIEKERNKVYQNKVNIEHRIYQIQGNINELQEEISKCSKMAYYPYSIEQIIEKEQEWKYGLYDNSPDIPATYNLLKKTIVRYFKITYAKRRNCFKDEVWS